VASFFRGALAIVVSLVVLAIWQVGKGVTRNILDLSIAVCLFVLLVLTGIHPLFVVLLGGGLGILLKR
jgi:chromate transport protein ChrA